MKVLVADDSQLIRQRLVDRLLRVPDITIAEAVDTDDALRQLTTFKPEIAVLDIRMPGGGGIKALTEIKKNFPGITVIIMTSYPYAEYRQKCLEMGADYFFEKSTDFEYIAKTVRQLTQSLNVDEIARQTAAAQLVAAKAQIEKLDQRQHDMTILSRIHKLDDIHLNQVYDMWEKTFDAMPDLIAIFDADHSIVRVNKVMADRLGLPAAELIGKRCYEYCHGTSCPIADCPHDIMLKDGLTHSAELYEQKLNGWFNVVVSPIYENGRLIGAIHVAHDITVRRETAKKLKQSEQLYRQLFESMHSGFALHEIICDEKGIPCDYRFLEINTAFEKLTGLKAKDVIGKTVKEVMPTTEEQWIKTYGKVALTGEPVQIDDFSGALDRHYSVSAYSPSKGQFATIFTDITDQKNIEATMRKARDAAEAANLIKTQFLANMSHELRTPLNAIIGLTELLEDSKLDDEQRDFVKTIGASGDAMLTLVTDLIDLSRIEMGKLNIKKEVYTIREVIEKAIALLSPLATKNSLALTCTVEDTVPAQITGDPSRLLQVLINLLNNSIKFTEKGFVRLTVRGRLTPAGSQFVDFSVQDSGEGMDEATLKRIFMPFQQGDNSNTRAHGGAGLGLTISKNLVEMMGGTIRVESQKGKGSLFCFHVMDQAVPKNIISADVVREHWRGRCICVWGDDLYDMRNAECLLERCGIMPRYAESIDSIFERLTKEAKADAVLCNLDMPGLTERLIEFRKLQPDVPWIGFTNWAVPVDDQIKNCFSVFIDRPLRPEQLHRALMQLSESKR
jgi:PAS domain S-box-containing protein